ncbi:dUTPase [Pseudoalteromonas phage B8b]|uniref:dUTPase n=1 Tax=Pseudoalteromonas phage B8b TaxID=1506997 RepID=A0A076G7J0_9CAUD|nr:dUTPase [Pseudoalteromonas phage B8b]
MITYEPKPFLDAAPVNALIHKRTRMAYILALYANNQYFKVGYLVKEIAKLHAPHFKYPSFTHSHINALSLANVYVLSYPTGRGVNTFTYSPTDSMAGGVSYVDGGSYCLWGVSLIGVGIHIRLSSLLQNAGHHKMQYNILLKQCNVVGVSYCYTSQPVKQSLPMIDNVIIVQSRPMSPHAKAYKAIQSGALVYVEVDNEFVAIGKIH